MSRYALGWLFYLVVAVLLLAALQFADVPQWVRWVFAFGVGWTGAKHLRALRDGDKGKR